VKKSRKKKQRINTGKKGEIKEEREEYKPGTEKKRKETGKEREKIAFIIRKGKNTGRNW